MLTVRLQSSNRLIMFGFAQNAKGEVKMYRCNSDATNQLDKERIDEFINSLRQGDVLVSSPNGKYQDKIYGDLVAFDGDRILMRGECVNTGRTRFFVMWVSSGVSLAGPPIEEEQLK